MITTSSTTTSNSQANTDPNRTTSRPKIKNSRHQHDYSTQTNDTKDHDFTDKDQEQTIKGSHRCITIHGSAPASGRRHEALQSRTSGVDLAQRDDEPRGWWSEC